MLRKQSFQSLELGGELKDFACIAFIEPTASSFCVSLGLSILESLIRLKSCPELTHSTWVSIFQSLSQTRSVSHDWSLSEKHSEFRKLLELINNSDRKQSGKFLDQISNDHEKLIAIDYGMRFVLHRAISIDIEQLLKGNLKNPMQMLKKLSDFLQIGIGIGSGDRLKEFKPLAVSPMIFIYLKGKDQFGIMYHRAAKYIDEKPDLAYTDCSIYPFTTKLSEKASNYGPLDFQAIVDLVEILADNLKDNLPMSVRKHIYEKVTSIGEHIPMIKEIPALCRIEAERSNSKRREVSEESDSNYKLYTTSILTNSPNYTTSSLLAKKMLNTPSPRKKKNYSNDFYSKMTSKAISRFGNCKFCNKIINSSDFTLIACPTHTICIKCRSNSYNKGNYNCPECYRSYTIREHNLLRINDASKKAKILPKFY